MVVFALRSLLSRGSGDLPARWERAAARERYTLSSRLPSEILGLVAAGIFGIGTGLLSTSALGSVLVAIAAFFAGVALGQVLTAWRPDAVRALIVMSNRNAEQRWQAAFGATMPTDARSAESWVAEHPPRPDWTEEQRYLHATTLITAGRLDEAELAADELPADGFAAAALRATVALERGATPDLAPLRQAASNLTGRQRTSALTKVAVLDSYTNLRTGRPVLPPLRALDSELRASADWQVVMAETARQQRNGMLRVLAATTAVFALLEVVALTVRP
jgi:hypothetical protein